MTTNLDATEQRQPDWIAWLEERIADFVGLPDLVGALSGERSGLGISDEWHKGEDQSAEFIALRLQAQGVPQLVIAPLLAARERAGDDRGNSLVAALGGKETLQSVVVRGLEALEQHPEALGRLIRRPSLLLRLQRRVLIEGGYWERFTGRTAKAIGEARLADMAAELRQRFTGR